MFCETCGEEIPELRVKFLLENDKPYTCIGCSQEKPYIGVMVAPHKTGMYIVPISQDNKEKLRQALRCHRRAR